MIKFENTEVVGWEAAIRGMRNPMNSWEMSDTLFVDNDYDFYDINGNCGPYNGTINPAVERYVFPHIDIGPNDLTLMKKLRNAGTDHRKYLRMIVVYVDITAPLYWWKEFDTYKVGTVANSCSTMHKITEKEFTLEDFSCEHLFGSSLGVLEETIGALNYFRDMYINGGLVPVTDEEDSVYEPNTKDIWWQMIQLLPSSYNQRRTVMLNYEVLANIYKSRKNHKLDEWALSRTENAVRPNYGFTSFCDWIETLPYSELITGIEQEKRSEIKGLDGTTYIQDEDKQGWTGSSYSGRGEGLWQPGDEEDKSNV